MKNDPIMDDEDAYLNETRNMRLLIQKLCEYIELENGYDDGSSVDLLVKEGKRYYEKI